MQEIIAALADPGSLNQDQLLAVAILIFVTIASIYFVLRLFRIIRNAGKSTYKPNIGLSRTGYMHAKRASQEQGDSPEGTQSDTEGGGKRGE